MDVYTILYTSSLQGHEMHFYVFMTLCDTSHTNVIAILAALL